MFDGFIIRFNEGAGCSCLVKNSQKFRCMFLFYIFVEQKKKCKKRQTTADGMSFISNSIW